MHTTFKRIARALLVAAVTAATAAGTQAADRGVAPRAVSTAQDSVITVNNRTPETVSVTMGVGKSKLVTFQTELRDVLVSDPEKVDAVVQSSNRVFLIAKKSGQTNAFFFDVNGRQVLTLEISVGADLGGLDNLLHRLIPGSNIRAEMAGGAIVLTGAARTPIDSKRAADIACQFAAANKNLIGATYTTTATPGGPTTTQGQVMQGQNGNQGGDCGASNKLVINLLNVEGEEQVMLKVTVAEVQRTLLKQLGVNLGASINSGNFSTSVLTENALPLTAAAGLGTMPIPGIGTAAAVAGQAASCATMGMLCNYNQGPQTSFGNSGINGGYGTGNVAITHAIRALERVGLVRTLAEPNLTAVSGETAKFLAGGEFPIPVVDSDGKLTVTFKEFGIGVAFTPVVMSEGRISLKIESEVSDLTNTGAVTLSNISIPALKKRSAKSTVELPSGGSLAIAGLISDDTRQNIDGVPGMKDLPVLGTLFRSRDFQKSETELVVIVTPYMVRPTARQNLVRPDDGFAPASDLKANFLGELNRVYGKSRRVPDGGLKGDYGFIVE
ncbi:MAG: type II and III secretion system protein family protein [Hyphomicrobiaceae bacterium]